MSKQTLDRLLTLYNAFYSALYAGRIEAPNAAAEFDRLLPEDYYNAAVVEFGDYREDPITSDREAAAFYLAFAALRGV